MSDMISATSVEVGELCTLTRLPLTFYPFRNLMMIYHWTLV
jgi:hypothetical protein